MVDTNKLRSRAIEAMHSLFDGDFDGADAYFHPQAKWWIIGQGEMSYQRIRELTDKTEGGHGYSKLTILGTVAEGNRIAIEAKGDMELVDGRRYENFYHHIIDFEGDLIISFREYLDTAYVQEIFGSDLYDTPFEEDTTKH